MIGCGGRGTGATTQALMADSRVKLTAMADVFEDRLQQSLKSLKKTEAIASKIDVPRERQFVGFDAYKQLLMSGVDVVLLTTPPHFRPSHLQAAVAAGKHVFAEKPCAVDAPGVHSVLRSCEEAKKKNLAVVSGLCLRYHFPYREAVHRIQDGAVGEVRTLLANDYRGPIWVKPRQPEWTDMDWQMQKLVLLHLALRRLQRRTACAQSRSLCLDHGRPVSHQSHRNGGTRSAKGARVWQYLRPP